MEKINLFVEEDIKDEDGLEASIDDVLSQPVVATAVAESSAATNTAAVTATSTATVTVTDTATATADELHVGDSAAATPAATENPQATDDLQQKVQKSIQNHKETIETCKKEIAPLKKILDNMIAGTNTSKNYLKKTKGKIKDFKNERKRSGEGIESEMVTVLKRFRIEIRAYHGGTLHGKDVRKLMNDSSDIFMLFANILKAKRMQVRRQCDRSSMQKV